MKTKISRLDISEYLDSDEMIAEYLSAAVEENDQQLLLSAIGDIAKAKGMKVIAEKSGLGRESLYKAFAPRAKPRFETVLKVINSLGVSLKFKALTSQLR